MFSLTEISLSSYDCPFFLGTKSKPMLDHDIFRASNTTVSVSLTLRFCQAELIGKEGAAFKDVRSLIYKLMLLFGQI